tara:strand:+ start:4034 stop:5983 length:1950 start_codon:yes stop_codon:yes gene_type:complete
METIIVLSLAGLGYILSNSKKALFPSIRNSAKQSETQSPNPTNQSLHTQQNQKAISNFRQSLQKNSSIVNPDTHSTSTTQFKPNSTRIQSVLPNQGMKPSQNMTLMTKQQENFINGPPTTQFSSLTGTTIENFTHANQVPFFGSKLTQNTDFKGTSAIMETMTGGRGPNFKKKKEVEQFFAPKRNMGTGNLSRISEQRSRMNPRSKNNELPWKQIRVGPGLNRGYTADPSGGFHNSDIRDYRMPKTTNQLRAKTNPKQSFQGRIKAGRAININRPLVAPVIKRNPERYFEQSHDQLLKTTASVLKSKKRAPIVFRETHRTHSKAYSGIAAPNNQESATSRAEVQQSIRQNYVGSGPRNLERQGAWDDVSFGDYGKDKVVLSMNSRDITGTRTHITNFRSEVPNQQASLQDQAKTTKKENFIGNNRPYGNMGQNKLSNLPVYDPNDVLPTTIKETTIDNNHMGIMSMPDKSCNNGYVIENSTKHAPTTNKETTLSGYTGIATLDVAAKGNGYKTSNYTAKDTHKQELSDRSHIGGAKSSRQTSMSYDDIYNATIREVTHQKETIAKGRIPANQGAKQSVHSGQISVKLDKKAQETKRIANRSEHNSNYHNILGDVTKQPISGGQTQLDRYNPDILDTFKKNPYTKSLHSV